MQGTKGGLKLNLVCFSACIFPHALLPPHAAFEPQSTAASLLRCSATANQLKNLHVVQEGISQANGAEW